MAKKEEKTNKKEKNLKDKKSFFKSFKGELKKVSWPTPKQLVNNTVAVIVIVIVIAAIVFVLDLAFDAVNKYGIDKIKESVVSTQEANNENKEENNDTKNEENLENKEDTTVTDTVQESMPETSADTTQANQ